MAETDTKKGSKGNKPKKTKLSAKDKDMDDRSKESLQRINENLQKLLAYNKKNGDMSYNQAK